MEKGKKKSIMSDPAVTYNADIYRLKVKGMEALMGINDPQDLKNAVDYLKRKLGERLHYLSAGMGLIVDENGVRVTGP